MIITISIFRNAPSWVDIAEVSEKPVLPNQFTLTMEAAGSSRNVGTYLIHNRPNNPENNNLHNYRRENLSNLRLALECVVM